MSNPSPVCCFHCSISCIISPKLSKRARRNCTQPSTLEFRTYTHYHSWARPGKSTRKPRRTFFHWHWYSLCRNSSWHTEFSKKIMVSSPLNLMFHRKFQLRSFPYVGIRLLRLEVIRSPVIYPEVLVIGATHVPRLNILAEAWAGGRILCSTRALPLWLQRH